MPTASLIDRIQTFNRSREPERLQLKYQKMRSRKQQNAFAFLRSTCHLFYEDWSASAIDQAPLAWICGDLHLENFGVYKGDNRLTYFDINDFDEAALAPCTWDLARFLTSLLVAAPSLGLKKPEAIALCQTFLQAYRATLAQGKAQSIERKRVGGIVGKLLVDLEQRDRKSLLDDRTELTPQHLRQLRLDPTRTLPLLEGQRGAIETFMPEFAAQFLTAQQAKFELFRDGAKPFQPEFFALLDAGRRIAGGGSLGLGRYVLLVAGKGSPDGNYLLDLKQAQPSALAPYLKNQWQQPQWSSPAERIIAIQQRVQAVTPALLSATQLDETAYLLKELQPAKDPADFVAVEKLGRSPQLEELIRQMGRVVAWGELRSSGRQGSATADELIEFARDQSWQNPLIDSAQHYSKQVRQDWKTFSDAFDDGLFGAAAK
jgi:uncharacterized protein (DUF2252 family)